MLKHLLYGTMIGTLIGLQAQATTPVLPIWEMARQKVQTAKPLAASRVTTHLDVYDGKENFLGSIETVEEISSWNKDGSPIRVTVSNKTLGSPGFTMELNLHFEDQPGEALDGFDTWTSKGDSRVGDTLVQLYDAVDKSQKEQSKALAYIDPKTALPLQVDYLVPIHSNFGTRMINATLIFGPTRDGIWVPKTATINQAGKFMFWRRHLVIKKIYENWIKRP
jgi:hypothetical protein